jgi:hypothetical protein
VNPPHPYTGTDSRDKPNSRPRGGVGRHGGAEEPGGHCDTTDRRGGRRSRRGGYSGSARARP